MADDVRGSTHAPAGAAVAGGTATSEGSDGWDADVIVVGSGFGGSVAALRFAQAGEKVLVLERGTWVTRRGFEPDMDAFWNPRRNAFGFHDIRKRGDTLFPWLGAAVGGGSHVYAGTLKRRESFDDFPCGITAKDLERHYARAEHVLGATPYPDYAPYDRVRATQFCFRVGERLRREHPALVQACGALPLGISFAPKGSRLAGTPFRNEHGAWQRYQDPREQSILGGDIDCKNTLDKNYLFLAQGKGARIAPLHEVDRIAPLDGGGWRVTCRVYRPERRSARGFLRRWLPGLFGRRPNWTEASYAARRLVISAGAVGSTELLLRARDVHRTLPRVGSRLGGRYTTNGDYVTLVVRFREMAPAWLGFAGAVAAWSSGHPAWLVPSLLLYYWALVRSGRPLDPDLGTTNSDYVQFAGRKNENQGAFVESGRYPNPGKSAIALVLSALHLFHPRVYVGLSRMANVLRDLVPPFGAFARTWPIPLLTMGKDDAFGTIELDRTGRAVIRYDGDGNAGWYGYATWLGQLFARAGRAGFLPNPSWVLFRKLEIPHNQGGVPMGDSVDTGVVDDCGRVFGYDDLMVLDGSILPVSTRPNPALTIAALSERAMERVVAQLRSERRISARPPSPAAGERRAEAAETAMDVAAEGDVRRPGSAG